MNPNVYTYWRIVLKPWITHPDPRIWVEVSVQNHPKGGYSATWDHSNDFGRGKTEYDAVMDLASSSKDQVYELVPPGELTREEYLEKWLWDEYEGKHD